MYSKSGETWRWCRAINQRYLSEFSGGNNPWICRVLAYILKAARPSEYGQIMNKQIFKEGRMFDSLARNTADLIWERVSRVSLAFSWDTWKNCFWPIMSTPHLCYIGDILTTSLELPIVPKKNYNVSLII